jgi:hypothetical protein
LSPLDAYERLLTAWRVAVLDLPLALAASVDSLAAEAGRMQKACCDRMGACDNPCRALAEQVHASTDFAEAASEEGEAFARDLDLLVKPLTGGSSRWDHGDLPDERGGR